MSGSFWWHGNLAAVDYTFSTTTGGTYNWSGPGSGWDATPVSDSTTNLFIGTGGVLPEGVIITSNQDVASPFFLNSLVFNYTGEVTGTRGTVNLTGGTLRFTSDGVSDPRLVIAATGTTGSGGLDTRPILDIDNHITLNSTLQVSGSGSAVARLDGNINGIGGINKTEASRLVLAGNNSFFGNVNISGAGSIIEIESATALGSTVGETVVTGNGQLGMRGGITVTGEILSLRGDGGTSSSTQGALRSISGNNEWNGTIQIDSTVVTRIASSSGTLTLSGSVITSGNVANGLVFQGEGNIVVSGAITGNAQITRSTNGAGTVFFSGDNGIDDPTASTQRLGKLTVSNGEVVFMKRHSFYYKEAGEDVAIWSGANLVIAAGRAIGFNVGGTDEFTAADIKAVNQASAATAIANGAQLWLNTANASGGTFSYDLGLDDWGAGRSLVLFKQGNGTLELNTANTYTGTTVVEGGTLRILHAQALGSNSGKTDVKSNATLELSGGVTVNGETLDLVGNGAASGGALRSTNGHNVWNGNLNVNTSTTTRIMAVNSTDSLTITGNVATTGVHLNGVVLQGNGKITITGDITGEGSLTRSSNGNGLVILSGNNTYTGGTIISNGTLQVGQGGVGSISGTSGVSLGSGVLAGSGTVGGRVTLTEASSLLSAGDNGGLDAGTLTLSGGLTLRSDGGTNIRFNLGSSSDLIVIDGGSFIGNSSGLTTFNFVTGAGFANGTYDLIDWSSLGLGGASDVEITDFDYTGLTGLLATFNISSSGVLQLIVVPEPSRALLIMVATVFAVSTRTRRRVMS